MIGLNCHRLALTEHRPGDANTANSSRAEARERPLRDLPALVLGIDVDVQMRIDPFDLRDDALERERLLDVELSREGMMRGCRHGSQQHPSDYQRARPFE